MKFNTRDRGNTPAVKQAELSGVCLRAVCPTPEYCPLGFSEVQSILRKAHNA